MSLKKFTFLSMMLFLNFFFFLSSFDSSKMLTLNYFLSNFENYSCLDNSVVIDLSSVVYLFMVCLVVTMVSFFSEVYMEHYNNKKFFFLMSIFFSSMLILSVSGSPILLFVGWDGLGLSSICLIMFYPNKTTLYNSILTMFYNRLGDVMLIVSMTFVFMSNSMFYNLQSSDAVMFFIFLCLCSLTKSAQFPLSSWLPAAMSAPTPISAMVHSSTLVTAGIFLVHKIVPLIESFFILDLILFLSILTFFLGGFMATLELDLKKVVAFSTMSQISMILYFCCSSLISLGLFHMVLHAFFKTLLFCSSGYFFLSVYSNQNLKLMTNFSDMKFLSFIFFLSIFSMSGLTFSSSFHSKDLVLEDFSVSFHFFFFLALVAGSFLTMLYCSKLMDTCFSWETKFNTYANKNILFFFYVIFIGFVWMAGISFKYNFLLDLFPMVSFLDLWILTLTLAIPLFSKLNFNVSSFIFSSILEISFMKFFSFSIFSNFKNSTLSELSLSDHFFFKPSILSSPTFFYANSFISPLFYLILLIFILICAI